MQLPTFGFRASKIKILVYSIFLISLLISGTLLITYWRLTRPKESQMGEGIFEVPATGESQNLMIRGRVEGREDHVLIVKTPEKSINVEIPVEAIFFDKTMKVINDDPLSKIKEGEKISIGGVKEVGEADYFIGSVIFLSPNSFYLDLEE